MISFIFKWQMHDVFLSSIICLKGYSIGSKMGNIAGPAIYLDLAYLPSSHAASTIDVEFFSRLRSSCYIVSGDDTLKEAILRPILDAILDGKSVWPDDIPVSFLSY